MQPFSLREEAILAPYAFRSENSRGRRYPESSHPYRGPFQRDRDRIIHCAAYRRLSEKTQVFTMDLGDYHRTRLTHTLEVTSVARTLARALGLNEDLTESLGLLHDVGHPPFGHTGEDALDEFTAEHGGFNHNKQALRVVEKLERRYPHIPGLNLSEEVLIGQEFRFIRKKGPVPSPLLEVQIVDAADGISYSSHDADDALELGFLSLEDLDETAIWREASKRVRLRYTNLETRSFRAAVVHELIDLHVSDVLEQSRKNIIERGITAPSQLARLPILIDSSPELGEQNKELGAFLFDRVYRHPKVVYYRKQVREWLKEIFSFFTKHPELVPGRYEEVLDNEGAVRAVADMISDMTDRSAKLEYLRLVAREEVRPKSPIDRMTITNSPYI